MPDAGPVAHLVAVWRTQAADARSGPVAQCGAGRSVPFRVARSIPLSSAVTGAVVQDMPTRLTAAGPDAAQEG